MADYIPHNDPRRAKNLAQFHGKTPKEIKNARWYHGTNQDFSQFRQGRAGAIYVSPNPEFASFFASEENREGGQPNVLPVHVRAENPFDYENKKHINALFQKLGPKLINDPYLMSRMDDVREGHWHAIEDHEVQKAIKAMGHDSFYVSERGDDDEPVKNLAVYNPSQLKSATGNVGAYDTSTPDITKAEGGTVDLSQYQDSNNFGLYSHAAETAAALPQAKGTPDQFKAMLMKQGVKPVEIENSNYDETFAGRPSVTKDELVQHFRQNMPKIQEHVLGAKPEYPQHLRDREQAIINSYQPRIAELQARAEDYSLPSADRSEARDDVQDLYDQMHSHIDREIPERGKYLDVTPTKFHNYTMPGGENYRELLLQLKRGDNKLEQKAAEAYQRKSDLVAQYDQIPPGDPRGPQIAAQIQEAQREYSRIVDESMKYEPRPFNAGHWDQADVLAHLRMKDRTGPNGEKILHVDEIQSDWGQHGRSKGFSDPKAEDRYNAHVERMRDRLREETRKTFEEATKGQSLTPEDKERILRPILNDVTFMHPTRVATALGMQDDHQRAIDELRDSSSGVPHGPYVTNTAAWTDLALKRALHEAASGGYDKIVFTKGQDQADRYDLSNQIEHIEANPLDNGRIHLVATSKEDGDVVHEGHHDIDKIDDVIGKELADKVRSQIKFPEQKKGFLIKNKRSGYTADMLNTREAAQNVLERFPESLKPDLEIVPREYTTQGQSAVLRGVDLKIGGEGMKSFYDKIVPTQLMNIVKKMDPSAKMETALLNTTGEEWPYSIQIAHDGDKYWLKGRHPDKPGDVQLSDKFDGYEQADDLRRMMYAGFHKPVHALTITPKMRDSILRGQKAFAAGGEVDDDGITAYHGSPYDFERFDSSKIGTNEGTAFGHGLYFAGSEPVAQTYRGDPEERYRRFSGHMTPKEEYAFDLASRSGDVRDFDVMTGLAQKYGESIDFDEAAQLARNAISKRGHMYEVGINAQPHHFLDWDKPIQEQPYVMEQLIKAGVLTPDGETSFMYNDMPRRGGDIYERLTSPLAEKLTGGKTKKHASDFLHQAGIKGVRYNDGKSTNYVVFDDKLVNVKRKYAQGGMVEDQNVQEADKDDQEGGKDRRAEGRIESIRADQGRGSGRSGKLQTGSGGRRPGWASSVKTIEAGPVVDRALMVISRKAKSLR